MENIVSFDEQNLLIIVDISFSEISMQELYNSCKDYEEVINNMDIGQICKASGKEPLGGGVSVGITITLLNGWRLKFADRAGPTTIVVDANGGNLVAQLEGPTEKEPTFQNPVAPSTFVTVTKTSSASATTANQAQLEYSTFSGGVTIDVVNGEPGTEFPIGSPSSPCSNITDATQILVDRGFKRFFIVESMSLGSEDFSVGILFRGLSSVHTILTLLPDTNIDNCIFESFTIKGVLDNDNVLNNCLVDGVTSLDGQLKNCGIQGTLVLGGDSQTTMLDCYSNIAGSSTPMIDIGTGSALAIRGYKGGLKLINKTGTDACSIDLDSGHIIVDSSCTSGEIVVRGLGKLTNNSGGTFVVEELLASKNLNHSVFTDGAVQFNSSANSTGTSFPFGTALAPVNSLADALLIAIQEGLDKINVVGFVVATAAHNLDGLTIIGGSGASNVIGLSGCSTNNSEFEKITMFGAQKGLCRLENCVIGVSGLGGLTGTEGKIVNCTINLGVGITQNPTGFGTLLDNCSLSIENNEQVTVDANGLGLSLRMCTGNILIKNKTDDGENPLHMIGAQLEIDPSCTAGKFYIAGSAQVTDNSNGTIIDLSGLGGDSALSAEQEETLNLIKFQDQKVFINTESGAVGDGSARNPFNTVADALDFAEEEGIQEIVILADATLDRNFKGFKVRAIGLSSLDLGGQDVTNTIFRDVRLKGDSVTGAPTFSYSVTNCSLDEGLTGLSGGFVSSTITGNVTLAPGLFSFFTQMSTSSLFTTPAISMPAGATHRSTMEDVTGDLMLKDFTIAGHTMAICLNGCCLTIDSSCVGGTITVTGAGHIIDNSEGTTLEYSKLLGLPNIEKQIWEAQVNDHKSVSGSFAEYVGKKLLSVSKFLGLK